MAKVVDFNDLGMIVLPEQTETYIPVSHQELVTKVANAGEAHYGKAPTSTKYEINHKGQQLFGSMKWTADNGMERAIGFRNSYNKTLPVGVCGGASVMVCSNLMFVGDVINMRKHTANVKDDLDALIVKLFEDVDKRYTQAHVDAGYMQEIPLSNEQVGDYLGQLFVNQKVLNSSQMTKASDEWFNSNDFKPRTLWSAYNACTEALKSAHPSNALEKYTKLHTFTEDYTLAAYKEHLQGEFASLEGSEPPMWV